MNEYNTVMIYVLLSKISQIGHQPKCPFIYHHPSNWLFFEPKNENDDEHQKNCNANCTQQNFFLTCFCLIMMGLGNLWMSLLNLDGGHLNIGLQIYSFK